MNWKILTTPKLDRFGELQQSSLYTSWKQIWHEIVIPKTGMVSFTKCVEEIPSLGRLFLREEFSGFQGWIRNYQLSEKELNKLTI